MADIPLWTVHLTYDTRSLLAWGLENFTPMGADLEMADVMRAAVRDKSESFMVHAGQIDYLDRLGCAALASGDPVLAMHAQKLFKSLPDPKRKKPDGIASVKGKPQQGSLFD